MRPCEIGGYKTIRGSDGIVNVGSAYLLRRLLAVRWSIRLTSVELSTHVEVVEGAGEITALIGALTPLPVDAVVRDKAFRGKVVFKTRSCSRRAAPDESIVTLLRFGQGLLPQRWRAARRAAMRTTRVIAKILVPTDSR